MTALKLLPPTPPPHPHLIRVVFLLIVNHSFSNEIFSTFPLLSLVIRKILSQCCWWVFPPPLEGPSRLDFKTNQGLESLAQVSSPLFSFLLSLSSHLEKLMHQVTEKAS